MSRRPAHVPIAKGERLTLPIAGLGDGPDGLGRVGDYVVFVPGTLPGEHAIVDITSAAKKHGRGALVGIAQASPDRVAPRCSHFLACGGCHRQHQAYPAQLRSKQQRLQKALDHALGDHAITVGLTVPAAGPYGERHKVAVQLLHDARGRLVPGLHRLRSPELVRIDECPASDPLAWDLVVRTVELLEPLGHRAWDPWFAPQELLRSVLVRTTTAGDAHLVVVATAPEIPGFDALVDELHAAGATSISINHHPGDPARLLGAATHRISGPAYIEEELGGLRYRLSPTAFFQTSPRMAERIVDHVTAFLDPGPRDHVADLYCGVGLLTLPLAQRAAAAFGIESHGGAVDDARAAAFANRIGNVQFRVGDVTGWLAACRRGELPKPGLVSIDPPREGLDAAVIEQLGALAPRRLAYVSCEPATLARDLRDLHAVGFDVVAATPFDMFPQTAHVEAVACLERRT
jgi:23S rRNA (uracil1939-C5)-methyltransferase